MDDESPPPRDSRRREIAYGSMETYTLHPSGRIIHVYPGSFSFDCSCSDESHSHHVVPTAPSLRYPAGTVELVPAASSPRTRPDIQLIPAPPSTYPDLYRFEMIPAPPSTYLGLYRFEMIPAPPSTYPGLYRFEMIPAPPSTYHDLYLPSRIDFIPSAPSRPRHDMELIPAATSRPRHDFVPAAPSRHCHGSRHAHGHGHGAPEQAAATYMEEAERRRRARASEDAGHHDVDVELGLGLVSGSGDDDGDNGCNGDALCGLLVDVLFGMCIGGDTDAGEESGQDGRLRSHGVSKRFYELFYPVVAFIPPYLLYKLLPDDVVRGAAWTWFLILYAFVITTVTIMVSIRALSSRCCTSKCMRTLLFVASVAMEIMVYLHIVPDTKLARGGTLFSVFHLIGLYLLAWTPSFRRRLRRGRPRSAAVSAVDAHREAVSAAADARPHSQEA